MDKTKGRRLFWRSRDFLKRGVSAMAANEIIIRGLDQFYGRRQALRGINLTIRPGMFGLLGRNGAGKTTLMRTLATLLETRHGSVSVCGVDIRRASEIRQITGYLPQDFSMYPSMTVTEALDYLGILSGMSTAARAVRIPELLRRVNLEEQKGKRIKSLSGGMKRRLGIAQALLHEPKVLIVDEPTAGLDPEERIRFRNLLCEVAEDRVVLLSTHIVGDIEAACEDIAVLDQGELVYSGTVRELLRRAEGTVFSAFVPREEMAAFKKKYPVTSMVSQGDGSQVRFLCQEEPPAGAQPCQPGVEDAYLLCLGGEGE